MAGKKKGGKQGKKKAATQPGVVPKNPRKGK